MVGRVREHTKAFGCLAATALSILAAGCGSATLGPASPSADVAGSAAESCPETVMKTLGSVLGRVYHEGVESERTASARVMIEHSPALRSAIETSDATAARAAAKELVATGHLTNLLVRTPDGHPLVSVGGPALAPLTGTIEDATNGRPASYLTSVWADSGFAAEANGIAEGLLALRTADGKSVGGTVELPAGPLAAEGTLTHDGTVFQYTSFPARLYPTGPVTVYLLKPVSATEHLCGANSEATTVNTLKKVARLIYAAEKGGRTQVQAKRVQQDAALVQAVANDDPLATEAAVKALLHHHLVRLRVLDNSGRILADVGGPYVLAPVRAPLTLHGRRIGSIVLSIQDDEGYLRLAHRLAGLDVLMYMNPAHPKLVKNSLGPQPGPVPANGPYVYRGQSFQVFTLRAQAFPAGLLKIRVLVPIPYS
jgi:hypothetical protein